MERREAEERDAHHRQELVEYVRGAAHIDHSVTFEEAAVLLAAVPAFANVASVREREALYRRAVEEKHREAREQARIVRARNIDAFAAFLGTVEPPLTTTSQWRAFHRAISDDPAVRSLGLAAVDMLACFEVHMRGLHERAEVERKRQRVQEHYEEVLRRRAFASLLEGLYDKQGTALWATSSWREVFGPLIAGSAPFQGLLCNARGSTPLDLFWDAARRRLDDFVPEARRLVGHLVETLGRDTWRSRATREVVIGAVRAREAAFPTRQAMEAFQEALLCHLFRPGMTAAAPRPLGNGTIALQDATGGDEGRGDKGRGDEERPWVATPEIVEKVDRLRTTDRGAVDRLKRSLKHFAAPPIRATSTFGEFEGLLCSAAPDYAAIADGDIRRYYFEKFTRHLAKRA